MKTIIACLFLSSLLAVECSRILVIFPLPSSSHYILGNALAKGLSEAGHEVTMVSPFEDKIPPKNGQYRNIILSGFVEEKERNSKQFNMFNTMNPLTNMLFLNLVGSIVTELTLNHTNFQKLAHSNQKFDVIILEQFMDDGLRVVEYIFKAPVILFSTIGASRWVNPLVGNPSPPSYIPDTFLSYSSDMNFWQRLINVAYGILLDITRHLYFFPQQEAIMKKYFPDAPDLTAILYNTSLVFLNEHESINYPVPHVPSMISIGGFHVKPTNKLPNDLQKFLDDAKFGAIYFSMGSNLVPSLMPKESKKVLLKALGSLKQKVLWKWDEESLPNAPSNFKISKWFPQQDILGHPNIKLFITHGGLLSTAETIYHGVPVLSLPIFGDQKLNAARAEKLGYGITLPFAELTSEALSQALDELLHNPKYTENAKDRSKLLHDRPIKPLDLAVYWTEYVIRNKGAPHLKVAGIKLPWYQYLLLDVIGTLLIFSIVTLYLCYVCFSKLCYRSKSKKNIKIKST